MADTTKIATWVTVAAIALLCAPTLVFTHLPMTDLPQHAAVVSIIEHYDDVAYRFGDYYDVDWWRSPYVLPYGIWIVVGKLAGLAAGMHVAVFLSVILYPLAILALLRTAGKPAWFALLAIPLVYNRAFFWGFVHFNTGIGLALLAFALYVSATKSVARDIAVAVLVLLSTFCHVYALAMIIALVCAYAVCGGYRTLRARWWSLLPLLVGVVVWLLGSRAQFGYGLPIDPPVVDRVKLLPSELLGGYQDPSEHVILALFLAAWLLLAWTTLPTSRERLRALTPLERVAYLACAGNLVLYLLLPQATFTAKFIHFRHAILACALLPLLARGDALPRATLLARALPSIAAGAAIANSWAHLAMFDREARGFTHVVNALPQGPRLVALTFEPMGDVMATHPYLHFSAYAQAKKGGLISMTFPSFFWNLPVTMRPGAAIPPTPTSLEWNPSLWDDESFGYFYDHAIVRMPGNRALAASSKFPFELLAASPPWHVYRRVSASPSSPSTPR